MRKCLLALFIALLTATFFIAYADNAFSQDEAADEKVNEEDMTMKMTKGFKQAMEEVDSENKAQEAQRQKKAELALDSFLSRWINKKSSIRKAGVSGKIEQHWQDLLSTPPQHIDYYLRAFGYSTQSKELENSGMVSYPYNATVYIHETLYVDQAPLMGEPRSDYHYIAHTVIKLSLQYSESSNAWELISLEDVKVKLAKGWPSSITKKVGTYFIPSK